MRAGVGGAALGPYSEPGNVRISTDSATSNLWSSPQSTIFADSGVVSGHIRHSPREARLRAASLLAPVLRTGLLSRSRPDPVPTGMAVTSPAINRAPSAVSSSARLVARACRLRGHKNAGDRCADAPAAEAAGVSTAGPSESSFSGACDIGSILTGPPEARDKSYGCESWAGEGRTLRPAAGAGESSLRAVIDLKLLREDPDAVRRSQLSRGEDPTLVDALLSADAARRAAISSADALRAEQKSASKSVGAASRDERPALLARAKGLAEQVRAAETAQTDAEAKFTAAHMAISNVIIDGVPAGGEDDFTVLDIVGEPSAIDNPKDHLELGESLGLIDMQRGAKVSGSRFYFLTGQGALLQLGLLQLALRLAVENGFTPMIPPVLVRPEVMAGTGFLGAHADEIYRIE